MSRFDLPKDGVDDEADPVFGRLSKRDHAITSVFMSAHQRVIEAGYGEDVEWARRLRHVAAIMTPIHLMTEYAWVVVNSGFRYAVARKLFPRIKIAFKDFDPDAITIRCVPRALEVLNHEGKMNAIASTAAIVRREGVDRIVEEASDPPKLRRLPWIGAITCYHLAKLMGADVVKPDVHLQRAAAAAGVESPLVLCRVIKRTTFERITVADSVLWRYGEQQARRGWPTWETLFSEARAAYDESERERERLNAESIEVESRKEHGDATVC